MQFLIVLSTLVLSAYSHNKSNDDLVAVVQLFRHGQRTPTRFFPNDPYKDPKYWSVDHGQLVNEGKVQQYQLGKFTRQMYDGFLPQKYDKNSFYAFTTDVDRTHMSAQCNIAALFPPTGKQVWNEHLLWQPVPIHPPVINTVSFNCEARSSLITHVVTKESLYKRLNEKYADVYTFVSQKSGKKISTVAAASSIYDNLFIEELNGYNVSDWHRVYPEPLRTLSAYSFLSLTYTEQLKKIGAGLFIHYLTNHFEDMLKDPTGHKLKIYSAHDANIASVLNTIGAFKLHHPDFASAIYFELRKKDGEGYVNVWYKTGDDFTQITAKGCALDCPFSTFKKLLRNYNVDGQEVAKLCKKDDESLAVHSEVEEFLSFRE